MKKVDKNNIEPIDGQLSIFDIQITEKPKSFTKKAEMAIENGVLVTENPVLATKIITKVACKENEKIINPLVPTEEQQQFLKKNKVKENENLSRVIKYCGGGLGIEVVYENSYRTIYINKDGREEFTIPNKSPVLPMDKIMYYKSEFNANTIQKENLQKVLGKFKNSIKRVIKRKGDSNILIELSDNVIDILENGWIIDFTSINRVDCNQEDVMKILVDEKEEDESTVPEISKAKVGDYVQAMYGKNIIEGTIVREYGMGKDILNIIFDNGTKHTAIGKMQILKILKSA
ncbi:hypothetical protein [Clostridium carboxidivorans]|uniref:hypothetical protein n=1 Tax=Clostridium carboxidivorans TaxID=217159 RepID=UPI0009E62267|nr:hypothetical protein [Clostridium carboxidivorans]